MILCNHQLSLCEYQLVPTQGDISALDIHSAVSIMILTLKEMNQTVPHSGHSIVMIIETKLMGVLVYVFQFSD